MPKSTPEDHEFLDPDEWQAMNAILMLNRRVLSDLDSRLGEDHGLAVSEFDVLITLYNAPGRRLHMTSLAERVMLSSAGTSHLVTRLERDGLVRREVDPSDRRRWYSVLTDHGDEVLRAARRTHNAVLRHGVLSVIGPSERRALQRIWTRLSEPERGVAGNSTNPRPF